MPRAALVHGSWCAYGACLILAAAVWPSSTEAQFRYLDADSTVVEREAPSLLYRESHALLIANADYRHGWPDLPGVSRDSDIVGAALVAHGFEVVTIRDADSQGLKSAIDDFIFTHCLEPENRVVIYFLGHGHTLQQAFGSTMGYIVPADAPLPNTDEARFRALALDMQQFDVYAHRIQAKHALFVFDSCFSGTVFSGLRGRSDFIAEKARQPVRMFITSGSADEAVPDQGVFSRSFVDGIDGAADLNLDGFVCGTELGEYLSERVVNYSRNSQHPQYGRIRDRNLDQGDIIFRVAAGAHAPAPIEIAATKPEAREPASDFVVAVAPFYGALPKTRDDGLVLKQLVERQLYDFAQDDRGFDIVHSGIDQPIRSHAEARRVGQSLGAEAVIWGEIATLGEDVEIRTFVTRLPTFERARHPSLQVKPKLTHYPEALTLACLKATEAANLALQIGGEYYQYKDPARALEMLEAVQPPNAESLRFRALIHYESNEDARALKLLAEARQLAPDDTDLAVLESRILSDGGQFERAVDVARAALARDPASARVLVQIGSLYYDMGRYEEAMPYFDRAFEMPRGEGYADLIWLGFAYNRRGRTEDALAAYRRAAELDPGAAEPLVRAAVVHHAAGNSREALQVFERAWQMTRWSFVGNQIGGIYVSLGDLQQGIARLESVLAQEPDHPYAMQNLANAYALDGRVDESIALLRRAVTNFPELLQFRLYLHLALCRSGQHQDALRLMETYARNEDDHSVSALVADLFAGRLDESDLLRQARSTDAVGDRLNRCEAHYFLGMAYLVGASTRLAASAPDTALAIAHLDSCVATEVYKFVEYDYARAELRRLGMDR